MEPEVRKIVSSHLARLRTIRKTQGKDAALAFACQAIEAYAASSLNVVDHSQMRPIYFISARLHQRYRKIVIRWAP